MPPKAKAVAAKAKPVAKKPISKAAAKKDAPKAATKAKPAESKTMPAADEEDKEDSPEVEAPAKPAVKAKKAKPSPTKAEPAPEEPTTSPSKKRSRTSEGAVALKPTKRAKNEKSINTPPSERLDIYVFGTGDNGELGLGHVVRNGKKPKNVFRPRLNDLLDAKTVGVVQVAVGGMHCAALTHDNKIYTWGVNDLGALGRDTTKEPKADDEDSDDDDDIDLNQKESTPTAIPSDPFPEGTEFAQIVASDSATFALTTTGSVYGWGTFSGGDGVIGFTKANTEVAMSKKKKDVQRTPVLIPELKKIKILAAGGNHILALDDSGNTFTWGCGEQNQLGRRIVDRHRAAALVPSRFQFPKVKNASKSKIKNIACGAFHSFAIDEKDHVFAWGLNNFGQTGIFDGAGEANAIIETPELVESLAKYKITDIKGGNHHSVACTDNHKLLVWGRCDDSQPGIPLDELPKESLILNGQDAPSILAEPTIIPDISAVSVSAGIDNSMALTKDGEVYSWGFSANYRTGLGTEETVEEPTQIQNSALVGKKLTFSACGGQFSVLAGPASV
ncbi:Protein pim1 [Lachnellula suecica]|uniref:Protein pim1 n=1 Tax=Lachnellula suecica TaxID=602035 RepID=A0A8T9C3Z6_9HELO|nr:Protein pim1 [Lachnellula suecica]